MSTLNDDISKLINEIDLAESAEANSALNSTGLKMLLAKYPREEFKDLLIKIEEYEKRNPYAQLNTAGFKVFLNELIRS